MSDSEQNSSNWEREVLEKLAYQSLKEQKRNRFWGVFFKSLTFVWLFLMLFYMLNWIGGTSGNSAEDHTALIDIQGEIGAQDQVNADSVISSLNDAYDNKHTKGVILRINSPGGSPVQAGMINDEIHRLRKLYPKKPFYVVVEDICASGGYYVAVAADQILVDKASLVGSIGVIMEGFGFTGLMDKLGVTRRMITSGSNKGMLDPFSKEDPKQVEMVRTMIDEIHQQFIAVVKEGRGARLKDTADLFSGRVWNGEQAVKLGLADGFGTVETVARDVFKAPDILDYTMKENFAERVAKRFGAEAGAAAGKALIKAPDLK